MMAECNSFWTYFFLFYSFIHRVADPHSFDPDPDPAFYAELPIWIRIQRFDDQKLKEKKIALLDLDPTRIRIRNPVLD